MRIPKIGQKFGEESKTQPGRAKANGREPKTCLGQVFKYKFGCFDDVHVLIYVDARPHL
jgi:hypothetical protein